MFAENTAVGIVSKVLWRGNRSPQIAGPLFPEKSHFPSSNLHSAIHHAGTIRAAEERLAAEGCAGYLRLLCLACPQPLTISGEKVERPPIWVMRQGELDQVLSWPCNHLSELIA